MVQITLHLASPMTFLIPFFVYVFHHSLMQQVFFPLLCTSLCPPTLLPSLTSLLEDFILLRIFTLLPHLLQTKASCREVVRTGVSWPTLLWGPEAWSRSPFLSLAGSFVTAVLERGRAPSCRELTV